MKHKKYNKKQGKDAKSTVIINIKNLHIHMDERVTSTSLILPDETEGCDRCDECGECEMCEFENEEE